MASFLVCAVMGLGACGMVFEEQGIAESGGAVGEEPDGRPEPETATTITTATSTTATSTTAATDSPAPVVVDFGGPVEAVLALGDGRVAAASSDTAELRVWDPDDSSIPPVVFTEVHTNSSIWSLAELPDGRIVSGGADDQAVRVWDPAYPDADPILFEDHTGQVNAVAALPDGRVASAGADNDATVRIWNPDAPTEPAVVLSGHSLAVNDVLALGDGRLVSADWGGSVYVWDLDDPTSPVATFTDPSVDDSEPGHVGTDRIAQLSDGRLALGSFGGIVRILDVEVLETTAVFTDVGTIRDVVALDDGRLAWGGDQETVTLQDPEGEGATGAVYDAHTFAVTSLDVLLDGRIVSGSWDGTVRIWHPDSV